jgi:hypothetical protein
MRLNRFALSLLILCVGSTGIIMACSSDDTAGGGGTTTSGTTTVRVTAAAGGTVADPSGKTSLTIPPGALAADTDITLTLTPAANGALVDVSELGPDGLTFLKPVTLSIKADASLAPADKALAIAVLEGGAFKALEGSTYANGAASAPIMHFSKYSIIQVNGRVILQPPASCTAAQAGFTSACGGDPKGTWTFAEFCLPEGDLGAGLQGCPEASAEADFTITREVVIDATTITIAAGSQKTDFVINVPIACFNRTQDGGMYDSGVSTCADVQNVFNKNKDPSKLATCTDKGSGICACATTETKDQPAEVQQYTTNSGAGTITVTKSDGSMSTSQYCVNGNLLSIKGEGKDGGQGGIFVLNRK